MRISLKLNDNAFSPKINFQINEEEISIGDYVCLAAWDQIMKKKVVSHKLQRKFTINEINKFLSREDNTLRD